MSGSDGERQSSAPTSSAARLGSALLLALPAALTALALYSGGLTLVPVVLALGLVIALDARARRGDARWLVSPGRQLRRVAVGLELVALVGAAVVVARLAATLVASVEGLWRAASAGAVALVVPWFVARARLRAPPEPRLTSPAWAVALVVLAGGLIAWDVVAPTDFGAFVVVLVALVATALYWLASSLRLLARGALDRGLAARLATGGALWLAVFFVAVIKLSPLGHYDLWSFSGGERAHELTPSRRASINSHGFRGPERPTAKREGVLRVAVLGDSSSYGWMVAEPDTYARRLEGRLRDRLPGHEVEVLNAAVPGYDLTLMMRRFALRVRAHQPDVVVLAEGANDQVDPVTYRRALDQAVGNLRGMGMRVLLVGYPFREEDRAQRGWMNDIKREVASRPGTAFVDLSAVAQELGDAFYLADDSHPSAAGHRAIAEALAPALADLLARR